VRPPEEVTLMAADGGRQAEFRTEQVDGSGLSVILAEDRGPGADFRREVVIATRPPRPSMSRRRNRNDASPRERGARDVPGDAHDHLVPGARLGVV
jgi:hypothetical protein